MRRSSAFLAVLLLVAGCSSPPKQAALTLADTSPTGATSLRIGYSDGSTVEIQEPYRARTTTRTGATAWSELGVYSRRTDGTLQLATEAPPDFAGPDGHLLVALPVALREGLVARGGTATVRGRPCTEWTSAEPLDGADFAPATGTEQTVSCVGTDGLLLHDHWVRDGRVLRDRTIVSLSRGTSLAGSALVYGAAQVPAPQGETVYTETTATGADLTALLGTLPAPPPGEHQDLTVASRRVDDSSGTPSVVSDAGTVSYVGDSTLTVYTVTEPLTEPLSAPTGGSAVSLGSLGTGVEVPVYTGLLLQVLTARGLLVTIRSDLPEAALLTWARNLSLPSAP